MLLRVKKAVTSFTNHLFNTLDSDHSQDIAKHESQPQSSTSDHIEAASRNEVELASRSKRLNRLDSARAPALSGMSQNDLHRLIPSYTKQPPRDATLISTPSSQSSRSMVKPNDFSMTGPYNTLNKRIRSSIVTGSRQRSYGKQNRQSYPVSNLEVSVSRGDNVRRRQVTPEFPEEETNDPPRKRRKRETPKDEEPINLTSSDEELPNEPANSRAAGISTTSQPQVSSNSERWKNVSITQGGVSTPTEYQNLNQTLIPRKHPGPNLTQESLPDPRTALLPSPKIRNDHILYVQGEQNRNISASKRHYAMDTDSASFDSPISPSPDLVISEHFAALTKSRRSESRAISKESPKSTRTRSPSVGLPPRLQDTFHRDNSEPNAKRPRHADIADQIDDGSEDELARSEPAFGVITATESLAKKRAREAAAKDRAIGVKNSVPYKRGSYAWGSQNVSGLPLDNKVSQTTTRCRVRCFTLPNGSLVEDDLFLAFNLNMGNWSLIRHDKPVKIVNGTRNKTFALDSAEIEDVEDSRTDPKSLKLTMGNAGTTRAIITTISFTSPNDKQLFKRQWREACKRYPRSLHVASEQQRLKSIAIDEGEEMQFLESKSQHKQTQGTSHSHLDNIHGNVEPPVTRFHKKSTLAGQLQNVDGSVLQVFNPSTRTTRNSQNDNPFTPPLPVARSLRTPRVAASKANEFLKAVAPTLEAPEVEKYSKMVGLGQPWPHAVVYPPTGKQKATVEFEDLYRLDEGELLNDSLIHFWIRYQMDVSKIPEDEVYFFTSYFYSTLCKTGKRGIDYASVARWTAKVDLFKYKYIVIPINEEIHWYLAIIANPRSLLRPFDDDILGNELRGEAEASKYGADSVVLDAGPILLDSSNSNLPEDISCLSVEDESEKANEEILTTSQEQEWPPPQENKKEATASPFTGQPSAAERAAPISFLLETKSKAACTKEASPKSRKGRRKSAPPLKRYDPEKPVIIMLDSMGISRTATARNLKEYLIAEAKAKLNCEIAIEDINAMNAKGIPEQDNFSDCGLYLLGYMEKFLAEPKDFVTRILTRDFGEANYWTHLNTSAMRNRIRGVLMTTEQEQKKERAEKKRERKESKKKTQLQVDDADVALLNQGMPSSSTTAPTEQLAFRREGSSTSCKSPKIPDQSSRPSSLSRSLMSPTFSHGPTNHGDELSLGHTNQRPCPNSNEHIGTQTPSKMQVTIINDTPESKHSSGYNVSPSTKRMPANEKPKKVSDKLSSTLHEYLKRESEFSTSSIHRGLRQLSTKPPSDSSHEDVERQIKIGLEGNEHELDGDDSLAQRMRWELERSDPLPDAPGTSILVEVNKRSGRRKSLS